MRILTIDPGYQHLACGLYEADKKAKTLELLDFVSVKVTAKDIITDDKANRLSNLYTKVLTSRLYDMSKQAECCVIETPYEQNSTLLNQIAGCLFSYLAPQVPVAFTLVTWTNGIPKPERQEVLNHYFPHIQCPQGLASVKHVSDFWDTVGIAASIGLGLNYRKGGYG